MPPTALLLALVLSPAAAQPAPTLEEAIAAIREKAKPAYLAPSDIRQAVPAAELSRLNDPALKSADEPGARRSKIERFLEALDGIERLQNATAQAPLAPAEKHRLVVLIKQQLRLEDKEHSAAIGVYRPGQQLPGPLQPGPGRAEPAMPPREARVDLGNAQAAVGRVGPGDPFGPARDAGALGSAAPAAPEALRPGAPSVSPIAANLAVARRNRIEGDRLVEAEFRSAYRENGGGAISIQDAVKFYEEAGDRDLRPGEGALGYTARVTGATVARHLLEGVGEVQETVLKQAWATGSTQMSDQGRRGVAIAAIGAVGRFATDAIPGGAQAKTVAKVGVQTLERKVAGAATRAADDSLDFSALAPRPAPAPSKAPGDIADLDFTASAAAGPSPAQDLGRSLTAQERREGQLRHAELQKSAEYGKVQQEYRRAYLAGVERELRGQGLRLDDVYVHGTGAPAMRGIVRTRGMMSETNAYGQNGVWAVDGGQLSDTFAYAWRAGPGQGERAVTVIIRKDTGLVPEGQIFNRNPTIDDIAGFVVTDGKTSTFLPPQQVR
ncbi:MAG: hypothetical protein HY553_17985 [Elusimicrobia bacterium]|nr:hypothetical protein [Elusimicrobiota bacterium]